MRTPSSQKCRLDLAPPWADRFISGITPSITARHFSAGPSDSTSRWTPCPPKYGKRWLQVGLGCIQLSLSCPFRPLHTFRFLRPARLRTPLLGYGAPHLSARGTSTLLNNALLSAHFRIADKPHGIVGGTIRTPGVPETRSCVDCYRHPSPRPAGRWAVKLYMRALQTPSAWKAFREFPPAPCWEAQSSDG